MYNVSFYIPRFIIYTTLNLSTATTEVKDTLEVVMLENDTSTLLELRPRNRGAGSSSTLSSGFNANTSSNTATTSNWSMGKDINRVFIEHAVQPTDSLYKIGLLYSVPVSLISFE